MKLTSLKLNNFRQFYGSQDLIHLSDTEEDNVTVIFGANGAGKTTILNAFTWALFGQTTPALENPDDIICQRAILEAEQEDTIEARVRVEFEHDDRTYKAERIRRERKTGDNLQTDVLDEGELNLTLIHTDGETERPNDPSLTLEQVIPERLFSFFFFDGERIEELAKESAYDEVEEAIKNILGLQLLERSIRHLDGKVKRELDDRLSEVGTKETQEIIEKIKEKEREIEKEKEDLDNAEKNVAAQEKELEDVKGVLRERKETQDLRKKLDSLEQREEKLQNDISNKKDEIKQEISRNGYTAFIQPLINQALDFLEEKRDKGEIPSGIKKQFVEDLIEIGECICGTELQEGTSSYRNVREWLQKAGASDIDEAATTIGSQLRRLKEKREDFFSELKKLQEEKEEKNNLLKSVQEQKAEADHELGDKQAEDIQILYEKQKKIEDEINEIHERIGMKKDRIETLQEEKDELEDKKEEAEAKNRKANRIQKKMKIRGEAADFFQKLFDQKSDEVREELNKRIKEVYQKISYKDYWPEITEDYKLILRKGMDTAEEVSRDVAKSTGENQILSLSFIGSIVDYARDLADDDEEQIINFPGGVYPIAMDSPFGTLDENYRKAVAEGIPKLAEQVLVIVSKSQGKGVVLENLKSRIDRSYVLSFHTTKDQEEESLQYNGTSYPYIQKSDKDYEWAEIKEVT